MKHGAALQRGRKLVREHLRAQEWRPDDVVRRPSEHTSERALCFLNV